MKKIYISCYENNDYDYKNKLIEKNFNRNNMLFGLINKEDINNEIFRKDKTNFIEIIKNKFLQDSEVLVLLVGEETKKRKSIDWEIRAAMTKTSLFDKCGILIVYLDDVIKKYHGKIPREILPKIISKNINNKDCFFLETTWNKFIHSYETIEKYINVAFAYGKMSKYELDKEIKEFDDSNLF